MNERKAVFTITKNGHLYDIKTKGFDIFNRIELTNVELFYEMEYLTKVFNNVLNIAVMFEVG